MIQKFIIYLAAVILVTFTSIKNKLNKIIFIKSISLILSGILIGFVIRAINKHFPTTLGEIFTIFLCIFCAIILVAFGYSEESRNN